MLLLIGMAIGLILGLTGAGGSVFAVPLLMLAAGLPMDEAVGISLGAVATSTIYGSVRNFLQKNQAPVLWKPGVILAGTGILFAPLGKWLGMQLPDVWLLGGFSLLAVIIALRMGLSAYRDPDATHVVRAGDFSRTPSPDLICTFSETGQFELRPRCVSGLLIGGSAVGLLSGLFGVGGGFLIIPLFMVLSAMSMAQAVSTSLVIIALISSSGFISHLIMSPGSHWSLIGLVSTGGIIGMLIGQLISRNIAGALLQKLFAVSLFTISLITLARHLL